MSDATVLASGRGSTRDRVMMVLLAAALAVGLGVSAGDPTRLGTAVVGMTLAAIVFLWVCAHPFAGYLVMVASSVMLIVLPVPPFTANPFDMLLLPVLAGSYWGAARETAIRQAAGEIEGPHAEIRVAQRRLILAVLLFYGVAVLSLVVAGLQGRPEQTATSGLKLARSFVNILLFPLGLVWLRSSRRMHAAIGAVMIGGVVFLVVNGIAIASGHLMRAGAAWYPFEPGFSISNPNGAVSGILVLWALLLARHGERPQVLNLVMLTLTFASLVLTQSRSGLLAWLAFSVLSMRGAQWRYVIGGLLALAAAIPLIPAEYWTRMARTLVLERGSFEAYSSLVRLYAWKIGWNVFLDHPMFGIGWVGFQYVSSSYNNLGVVLDTVDNFYLQIAVDLGLMGLLVFGLVIRRMFQLGEAIRRVAPAGTLASALARFNAPLLVALLVANLTGATFFSLQGNVQLALWTALLVRAGHESIPQEPTAPVHA